MPVQDDSSADDRKRSQRDAFDEKSRKAAQAQREHDRERREVRMKEQEGFEKRATQDIAAQQEHAKQYKKDVEKWKQSEEEKRLDLERFKAKKAEEQRKFKEDKEKEREFEEKKHKYFESLHEAGARKALAEKADFDANRKLEKDLDDVDREAREEKMKAERECAFKKEKAEHDRLAERDSIDREYRNDQAKHHAEFSRRRSQLDGEQSSAISAVGSLPPAQQAQRRAEVIAQFRVKLTQLQREEEKGRQDLDAALYARRDGNDREALRTRNAAERELGRKVQEIEARKVQRRSALTLEREKLRRKG